MPTSSAAIAKEEEEEEEELVALARFILPPRVTIDKGAAATSPIPPPLPLRLTDGNESAYTISRVAS
jgi:hypothetical protein